MFAIKASLREKREKLNVLRKSGKIPAVFYGAGQDVRKKVKILSLGKPGLAETVEIRRQGWPSYTLRLRLIESEALETEPGSTREGPLPGADH